MIAYELLSLHFLAYCKVYIRIHDRHAFNCYLLEREWLSGVLL